MVATSRRFSSNVSDPIADMLTRIRNANTAFKVDLLVPASKMNESLLKILVAEGYLVGYELDGEGVRKAFRVTLKYSKSRQRTISGIKRVSKPGRRIYTGRYRLPRVLGGLGIAIVSTSQGVMTDKEASRKGIGGEVVAYVW
jgi:small subunit ribosomal protein S8